MPNNCGHPPTVLLINKLDPSGKFAMCDDDKTDPDFAEGFEEKKL